MAHIKLVTVDTIVYNPYCRYYAWTHKVFKTFTYDNGEKEYFINGKQVSMEEGNNEYLRLKKANAEYQTTQNCKDFIKREWKSYYRHKKNNDKDGIKYLTLHEADTYKQEVEEYDTTYEAIIEKLEASIDYYTDYIDNYKQQKEAEAYNAELRKEIQKFRKLIEEREEA